MNKKAAMFGLEGEPSKKQSGELFLVRLQRLTFRLVEGHQATRLLNSKGAMFGLDARIALAIFGALAVISGAVLYESIKKAETARVGEEMSNVAKAVEQYMLDTMKNLPFVRTGANSINYLHTEELISSSARGWNGPYLPFNDNDPDDDIRIVLDRSYLNNYIIATASNLVWGGVHANAADFTNLPCDGAAVECYAYVILEYFDDKEEIDALDMYFDSKVEHNKGRLRARLWDDGTYSAYLLATPELK